MKAIRSFCGILAAGLLLGGGPARADTKELDEMRADLQKLRQEVEALRAAKAPEAKPGAEAAPAKPEATKPAEAKEAAPAMTVQERLDAIEVQGKDAVVLGDIPGSFRVPGTELSLKLYGFAELTYVHEFKGDNSDVDYSTFAPYLPIVGTPEADRKNRDYLTARTSRIGVEAATPTRFGVLGAKIEGDFNNEPRTGGSELYGSFRNVITQQQTNSYNFRIRHAYGQFGGLLAGQTWSTFMDVDNAPETVDFNGPIGGTFIRQSQIRYTYATADWGAFTAAIENSSSYVVDNTVTPLASSASRMPDFIVRWDKGFDWGAASVRGMTQELRVDGQTEKATYRGWGVASTALVKLRDKQDYLSVGLTYGDGIGRYLNYIEGAVYDVDNKQILVERAGGLIVGYQLKPNDWVRVNFVYGITRNFNNAYTQYAVANGLDVGRFGINRTVQQAHIGPIFTPIKGVDLGIEAIWAHRKQLSTEHGDSIRYNVSAKYYLN